MESNWGRNVAKYGLAHTGATLAACIRGIPSLVITNAYVRNGEIDWWLVRLLETDPDPFWRLTGTSPQHGHFPYGLDVEPVVNL